MDIVVFDASCIVAFDFSKSLFSLVDFSSKFSAVGCSSATKLSFGGTGGGGAGFLIIFGTGNSAGFCFLKIGFSFSGCEVILFNVSVFGFSMLIGLPLLAYIRDLWMALVPLPVSNLDFGLYRSRV